MWAGLYALVDERSTHLVVYSLYEMPTTAGFVFIPNSCKCSERWQSWLFHIWSLENLAGMRLAFAMAIIRQYRTVGLSTYNFWRRRPIRRFELCVGLILSFVFAISHYLTIRVLKAPI